MTPHIDEHLLRELEQLTEANPMQFMQSFESLSKQADKELPQLLYLKARALVTMHQTKEAEDLVLQLLAEAVEARNQQMIAQCNLVLAKCYTDPDNPEKQKRSLDIAYSAAKNSFDTRIIVECLVHLGVYFQAQQDRSNAVKCFAKAEKLCDPSLDSDIILQVKIGFGTTYYLFGEHHKSLVYITDALQLALECGDINRQLLIINNLSTLYSMLSRFSEAEEILARGIHIAESNQIPMRKVLLLFNLGVLLLRQKLYAPALERLLECMQFADSLGFNDPQFQLELYSNLAGCYRYLQQPQLCKQYIDMAEELAKMLRNTKLAKEIALNKANLLMSQGQFAEAKKNLLDAKKYFQKHKLYDQLVVAQLNLADFYEQKKDYARAFALLKDISPIYIEYMGQVMTDKTNEFDKQLKTLLAKYDQIQENYSKLADRFTTRVLGGFVGHSAQHKKVLDTAMMAAQHPVASVLITGESGTGKDVIANLIHLNSIRSTGPFIAVNVSAITGTLLESEFFGHRKGAFTNAVSDHKGFFQQANNGTLFLDEIGDMPKELQSKLLRVLESRKVTPVGSTAEIPFDCRIISSTNRNLEEMLSSNQFRLDLFHRLNTLEIDIPPLRERTEDIAPLIEYYAELLAQQNNRKKPAIDSSFIASLKQYSFPGNVRELRNLIERLLILCPLDLWDENALGYLPLNARTKERFDLSLPSIAMATEKELIIEALKACNGKQIEAALRLHISESTLTRRIAKYKLQIYTKKGK